MTTCDRSPDAGSGHHVYKANGCDWRDRRETTVVGRARRAIARTAASTMITKEKHPMRVLFFRDHEISGLGPPGAEPLTVGVRAAGRAGPGRTARPGSWCRAGGRWRAWCWARGTTGRARCSARRRRRSRCTRWWRSRAAACSLLPHYDVEPGPRQWRGPGRVRARPARGLATSLRGSCTGGDDGHDGVPETASSSLTCCSPAAPSC